MENYLPLPHDIQVVGAQLVEFVGAQLVEFVGMVPVIGFSFVLL
jgi:hypothetical protein